MSFKSFLISKSFFKQLSLIFIVAVILLFAIIKALDIYTHNGEFILVPYLKGNNADSLLTLSSTEHLQFQIIDSVYADDLIPGTVITQNPKPESKVKQGRKIYLSIVAKTPEMVLMPNLIDLTVRRAVDVIQHSHLVVRALQFEDDIALNAVIGQRLYMDDVPPDTLLPSGSAITLVVGNGFKKSGVVLPFILGKNAYDARYIILKSSFNIGQIDTLAENVEGDLRVYSQTPFADPMHPETAALGDEISFVLRSAQRYNFDSVIAFYNAVDSVRYDSLQTNTENIDF